MLHAEGRAPEGSEAAAPPPGLLARSRARVPGLVIVLLVVGVNLLGDGLRDRTRRRVVEAVSS